MSMVSADLVFPQTSVDVVLGSGAVIEVVMTTTAIDLVVPTATVVVNPNAGAFYDHTQAVPASSWVIPHNLGKHPSVTVLDSLGRMVIGFDVVYTTTNSLTITFSAAFSGVAYLN